jgi:cAMP-dependent protein kinase regulator
MYENFLKTVDLFQTIDPYEISQISDALKTSQVEAGEIIIKQNDHGDVFYILEDGECYAEKVFTEGEQGEKVKEYKKGTYFGELALIKNEPRAASVIAKTDCKLLSLDRLSFKRLLGPIENLLKRNSEAYIKYIKN